MKKLLFFLLLFIVISVNGEHTISWYQGNESYLYSGIQATIFHNDILDENCNYTAILDLEINGSIVNYTKYYLNMTNFDYTELRHDFNASNCSEVILTNFSSYYYFNTTDCNESFIYYDSYVQLTECSTTTSSSTSSSSSSSTSSSTSSSIGTSSSTSSSIGTSSSTSSSIGTSSSTSSTVVNSLLNDIKNKLNSTGNPIQNINDEKNKTVAANVENDSGIIMELIPILFLIFIFGCLYKTRG